jgi:hypothetical protein
LWLLLFRLLLAHGHGSRPQLNFSEVSNRARPST